MEATQQEEALETGQRLVKESTAIRAEARAFMDENGIRYPLHEWITISGYAKKYNLYGPQAVSKWIERGTIPPEDILELPELGGVRLVRDKTYQPH